MTTPPQGPWGPGQPGGQPGGQQGGQGAQGGWGQQPPGQGGGGWGQRPQQPPTKVSLRSRVGRRSKVSLRSRQQPGGRQPPQPGQPPQQGGWVSSPGQTGSGPAAGTARPGWRLGSAHPSSKAARTSSRRGASRASSGRRLAPAAGVRAAQWQPGGPGGSKGPGGISKDKLPLVIGGGVVGIVLIGLLVFLGIQAFGGDDEPESEPDHRPSSRPANHEPTAATTTAATATASSATRPVRRRRRPRSCRASATVQRPVQHRAGRAPRLLQVRRRHRGRGDLPVPAGRHDHRRGLLTSQNEDNVNNAAVTFDAALQAIGNDTFGGSEVKKVQDAVKTGQKSQKVGSTWGEFQLRNDGDTCSCPAASPGRTRSTCRRRPSTRPRPSWPRR